MVDAWPDEVPHGIVEFEEVGGAASGGAFGGLTPATTASAGGPHWRASVTGARLRTAVAINAARALEGRLDGGAAPVLVPTCDRQLAPQAPGGAPMVAEFAGARGADERSVVINLSGGYLALVGGEHFSVEHGGDVGRRLYRIDEVTGGTEAGPELLITPGLREGVDTDTVIDFLAPSCPMRLESGFDLAVEGGRFSDLSAVFVEWFASSPANLVTLLRALTLSPAAVVSGSAEDTLIGRLFGTTATSTLTLEDDAGDRFKVSNDGGGVWSIYAGPTATDYGASTTHNITVRETLAGIENSPRDTVLGIAVTQFVAAPVGVNIAGNDLNDPTNVVTLTGYSADQTVRFSKPLAAASGGLLTWDAYSRWPIDSQNGGSTWMNDFLIYGNNGGADVLLFNEPSVTYTTEALAFAALAADMPVEFTGYTTYKIVGVDDDILLNRGGLSILVEVV